MATIPMLARAIIYCARMRIKTALEMTLSVPIYINIGANSNTIIFIYCDCTCFSNILLPQHNKFLDSK